MRRILALLLAVALSLIAIADGAYLSLVHVDLEFGGGRSDKLCHALAERGCTVTGGRFGDLAGIPVAVIGIAGAAVCLVLALLALFRVRRAQDSVRDLLVLATGASVLASAMMAILSTIEGSFCPFCVLWYGLNVGLLVSAALAATERRTFAELPASFARGLKSLPSLYGLITVVAFGAALGAATFAYNTFRDQVEQIEIRHGEQMVEELLAESPNREHAMAVAERVEDDAPRKVVAGAGSGEPIRLVEFSDFQCPFCKGAWTRLEAYSKATPVPIEFVFLHFPLDPSCNPLVSKALHPHACDAARASECARRNGKFWEYADLLFADQRNLRRDSLLQRAETLGMDRGAFEQCMADPSVELRLLNDIKAAGTINVKGTPTILVGGYRVPGIPRRPALDKLLHTLVERRSKSQNAP